MCVPTLQKTRTTNDGGEGTQKGQPGLAKKEKGCNDRDFDEPCNEPQPWSVSSSMLLMGFARAP